MAQQASSAAALVAEFLKCTSREQATSFLGQHRDAILTHRDSTGESVLHRAVKSQGAHLVSALLACGCDVSAATRDGSTALHVAVLGDDNQKIIELLLSADNANPNVSANGITPLALALRRSRPSIYVNLLLRSGALAAWHTSPVDKCLLEMRRRRQKDFDERSQNAPLGAEPYAAISQLVTSTAKDLRVPQGAGVRILALDGGGVRGMMELKMLEKLEEKTGRRVHELFDLICGTSTGGIVAIGLGIMRMSVEEMISLYERISRIVFDPNRTASIRKSAQAFLSSGKKAAVNEAVALEAALKDALGEATTLQMSAFPKVFVVSTRADSETYLFRNYKPDATSAYMGDSCSKLWEAARATSAAPVYLPPMSINRQEFVDGGLKANNPCEIAIDEAKAIWRGRRIACVMSLGTGLQPEAAPKDAQQWSIFSPSTWTAAAPIYRLVETLSNTVSLATQTEETHVRVATALERERVAYLRLQSSVAGVLDLDKSHQEALSFLVRKAEDLLRAHSTEFEMFCMRLRLLECFVRCNTESVSVGVPLRLELHSRSVYCDDMLQLPQLIVRHVDTGNASQVKAIATDNSSERVKSSLLCGYEHMFTAPGRYSFELIHRGNNLQQQQLSVCISELAVNAGEVSLADTSVHGLPQHPMQVGSQVEFVVCPRDRAFLFALRACTTSPLTSPGFGNLAQVKDLLVGVRSTQGLGVSLQQEQRGLQWVVKLVTREEGVFEVFVAFGAGLPRTSNEWRFEVKCAV